MENNTSKEIFKRLEHRDMDINPCNDTFSFFFQ